MHLLKGCLLSSVFCLLSSCHQADDVEVAAQSAKVYYDYLLQGQYDDYVAGLHQPDSIPAGYRSQLVANAKMFMQQQRREHRGIKAVRVSHATADAAARTAEVFLVLEYGDGGAEQVLVPMVREGSVWYLR